MNRRMLLTLILVCSVLLAAAPLAAAQETGVARVRLVHGIADAPAVDVQVDGQLAAVQLEFTQYTDYVVLPAGDHTFAVQAGAQPVAEIALNVIAGQALTVILTGSAAAPEVLTFEDDLSPLVLGNTRVTAIHAAAGVGAVDVVLPDGSPVLQGLEYGKSSGGIDIPANSYPLAVVAAGSPVEQALLGPSEFKLQAGTLYRIAVVGGPTAIVLETPVLPGPDSVLLRVAHGIAGAPAVDVYATDTLLVPGLAAGQMSGYIAIPPGTYDLNVRTAGETNVAAIASVNLDLSAPELAGQARTVAAIDRGDTLGLEVYADPVEVLDPATARVSVINALAGVEIVAALAGQETPIPVNTAFSTEIPLGSYVTLISPAEGSSLPVETLFNGGTAYTLLVTGTAAQPAAIVGRNALNFQPGSAALPAGIEVAVIPEAAPTEAPAVAEPTEAAAAETPTPEPVALPQQPGTAPTSGIIGLVYNLNPGANLQLREYPRADARSLGLVQAGTILSVQGRAGEPDFVALPDLPPNQDLDPNATWLLVDYVAADGSTITAWALAQFVQVTENGRPVRLANLNPLPSDAPGSAGSAAAAPTATPVNAEFFGLVYNLNPDARLNIRRTPDTLGEVLAAVPPGTVLEPTGITEDYAWAFVTYRPADGGEITGWASTEYVQFMFRGNMFLAGTERFGELLQRNLLTFVDGTQRGARSGTTASATTSAPSELVFFGLVYNLNPDANLNVRRAPDTLAEILVQLPPGTVIEPQAILEDFSWTFIIFRPETGGEISGWVSTEFVQFVFRGQTYYPVEDKINELLQRSLLELADPALRGEVSAEAAQAAGRAPASASEFRNQYVGTVVSDPGANLHLRLTPDAASQSLALIPSGANFLVIGRTTSGEWLQVEYDSTEGWVASAWVELSMNGRRVLLQDVPAVR